MRSHLAWWLPMAGLTIGLVSWPYGYYVLLRILVCGSCVLLANLSAASGLKNWTWLLGGLAVLYNPIFVIHLDRDLWSVINFATIWVLAIHMFVFGRRTTRA